MILVLTQRFDPTADYVVEELNRRGVEVLRCDPGDFPHSFKLTGHLGSSGWSSELTLDGRAVRLEEADAVYYRRPSAFRFGRLPEPVIRWTTREARAGVGGLLLVADRWLNHPHRMGFAEYKPVQLAAAVRAGLTVPRTIITNDPAAARVFAETTKEMIYKPLSASTLPEGIEGGTMIYASPVTEEDLADPSGIASTAHLFQERITHTHAVRLTVVDEQMYAATIDCGSAAARLDWRSDYAALAYEVVPVPTSVRRGVTDLMTALGLRFGALDFLATPDAWVFLEVNPNGQWAWIEDHTGLPITSAIADALTRETE